MKEFWTAYHAHDFEEALAVSYAFGLDITGPSACLWFIPGTWKDDE